MRRLKPMLATLAVALTAATLAPGPAAAQPVVGDLWCEGAHGSTPLQGQVLADLWNSDGPVNPGDLGPQILQGQVGNVPGLIRLSGNLRDPNDPYQNLLSFEVFLVRGNAGTGSYWINHMRHRETYMDLVLGIGGFTIYPEDGGQAAFACTT